MELILNTKGESTLIRLLYIFGHNDLLSGTKY